MIRNTFLILVIIIVTVVCARWLLDSPSMHDSMDTHEDQSQDFVRGPHNGRLLETGPFALEITIFESGVPAEFHVYPYLRERPVDPQFVKLEMQLQRTGNITENFEFSPAGEFLRGDKVVMEPHSFDISVSAEYEGKKYSWSFASYEGRTQITGDLANHAGIKTEIAGPARITESLVLSGRVEIDPNRLAQVRARFPGVVEEIRVDLGALVSAGQQLLAIQSNESLQSYPVLAPIDGLVIKRNVQPGEITSAEPLFTIADLSHVWVELDVFARDVNKIKIGQQVNLETLDGKKTSGTIDWLSPLSSHASQTIHVRVPLANPSGRLRPGQFVQANVIIAEHDVPLAIRRSAVQSFRDFQVVFARFADIYEVRMLEFGRADDAWLEVVSGLAPGTEYVTENSYLIKADIEKSGASHDH